MAEENPRERFRLLVTTLVVACVVGPGIIFVGDHAYSIYDDAYIYFRYVDNLFAGCGLRFNCSDSPVEGFTSPLYFMLLAVCRLATSNLEMVSQVLGPVFLFAALIAAAMLPRRRALAGLERSARIAIMVGSALLLGLDHVVLVNAVIGLEMGLAALVVALLMGAVLDQDVRRTQVYLVLAILARPECALFAVALPLLPWTRSRACYLPIAAAILVIVGIRLALFGDVVPNTYWAKAGGTMRHAELGWSYIEECVGLFPIIWAAPLALLAARARREITYFLVVALVWFAFFLRSGGDTFLYARLAFPLIPVLTVVGLLGCHAVVEAVAARTHGELGDRGRRALALAVVLPVLWLGFRAHDQHALPPSHGFANVLRWAQVGHYLRKNHQGQTIATVPIGAIGYFSGLEVIDLVGLTQPAIARSGNSVPAEMLGRRWIAHERHDTDWVLQRAPDLIVSNKYAPRPWTLSGARSGFYAEWLLMRRIKEGRAPYQVRNAEIIPGVYWLMFERVSP